MFKGAWQYLREHKWLQNLLGWIGLASLWVGLYLSGVADWLVGQLATQIISDYPEFLVATDDLTRMPTWDRWETWVLLVPLMAGVFMGAALLVWEFFQPLSVAVAVVWQKLNNRKNIFNRS